MTTPESESDEDLKRAIALSLQDSPSGPKAHTLDVIDLVSDDDDHDEDDDLDAPVTARRTGHIDRALHKSVTNAEATRSLAENSKPLRINQHNNFDPALPDDTEKLGHVPPVKQGLLAMDRKSMEQERLARRARMREEEGKLQPDTRLRKRQASMSPPRLRDEERLYVKAKFSASEVPDELGVRQGKQGPSDQNLPDVLSRNRQQLLISRGIQYPDGVVKKTWVYGTPRHGDDIKIEEVLQKNDLELAVLSAFQVEPEWIGTKLAPKTKVVWVLQAKSDAEKENIRSEAPKNFRFCFPSMEGNINCMHSKLQLLSHPTHLRVVIPSANLTSYDWGETGIMENVCFLIDLPRLPTGQKTLLTDFASELLYFAGAMGLDKAIVDSLWNFDFSHTARLALVHSIGGSHSGAAWKRTGYCGLGTAIQTLGLGTEDNIHVDFLAASIGSLNDNFMKTMYRAAQGGCGLITDKPPRGKGPNMTERKLSEDLSSRCRIYFPTRETVLQSKGGIGGGGTICLQSKWFDSESFPRHLMRDCKSSRSGLLMHSKMIFARGKNRTQNRNLAWVYTGSANLSESAWGRLVKDKATKEPKLNLRNWECGVVIPIPIPVLHKTEIDRSQGREDEAQELLDMDVFVGHVPVPMQVPGEDYGDRRPWFYNDR